MLNRRHKGYSVIVLTLALLVAGCAQTTHQSITVALSGDDEAARLHQIVQNVSVELGLPRPELLEGTESEFYRVRTEGFSFGYRIEGDKARFTLIDPTESFLPSDGFIALSRALVDALEGEFGKASVDSRVERFQGAG